MLLDVLDESQKGAETLGAFKFLPGESDVRLPSNIQLVDSDQNGQNEHTTNK